MILERYPNTIELAIAAMLIAILIAVPLGVLAGTNKGSLIDNFSSVIRVARNFSARVLSSDRCLVYVFAVKLGWFAPTGKLRIPKILFCLR